MFSFLSVIFLDEEEKKCGSILHDFSLGLGFILTTQQFVAGWSQTGRVNREEAVKARCEGQREDLPRLQPRFPSFLDGYTL